MNKFDKNRRNFLTRCALLSATGMASSLSSLGTMSLSGAALAMGSRPTAYRAMVCIYLTGGNDLNMMVPLDDYDNYKSLRGRLAFDREDLLPITSGSGPSTKQFGLHPQFGSAQTLYQQKKLAFIANTGALLEPTTTQDYINRSVRLPPQLFSHNTQKEFVRAGQPYNGEPRNGWAGRIADMYSSLPDFNGVPLNLSMSGESIWQRGANTVPYVLNGSSIKPLRFYDTGFGALNGQRAEALRQINQLPQEHLFTREYGRIVQSSLDLSNSLRSNISQGQIELQTQFPATITAQALRNVANVINARNALQMPQQIFYVNLNGWDHHDGVMSEHGNELNKLGDALLAFDSALEEMGLQESVVTFTNHDFGRSLVPNGNGSDHAWGGHQLVMGGKGLSDSLVKGGQVYGKHPILTPDDPQYLDFRGVLVPSTSTDQISATIAQWFGDFSDNELQELLPNLAQYNEKTLGFINRVA